MERSGAADDPQREQEHREKGEEHVEGDGLAESDAVWKDAAESAEEIFEYWLHRGCRRDYTVSDGQSCEISRTGSLGRGFQPKLGVVRDAADTDVACRFWWRRVNFADDWRELRDLRRAGGI